MEQIEFLECLDSNQIQKMKISIFSSCILFKSKHSKNSICSLVNKSQQQEVKKYKNKLYTEEHTVGKEEFVVQTFFVFFYHNFRIITCFLAFGILKISLKKNVFASFLIFLSPLLAELW